MIEGHSVQSREMFFVTGGHFVFFIFNAIVVRNMTRDDIGMENEVRSVSYYYI